MMPSLSALFRATIILAKRGFFVDIAEWLRLAVLAFSRFVEVPDVGVEVFYEAYEEVFVYMIECDVFPFVVGHPLDGAAHQDGAGVLAVGIIFGSHLLAVCDEVEFPAAVSVLESVLSVLDVDNVLGFDCVLRVLVALCSTTCSPCCYRA